MKTQSPFSSGDAQLELHSLSGTVVGTDQRSDSRTTGGSRFVVFDGSGGGGGSVSTQVSVARDIWMQDGSGEEHHIRVNKDIPVRAGQQVAFIYCRGRNRHINREMDTLASVYVVSVNKSYSVTSLKSLAEFFAFPPSTKQNYYLMLLGWAVVLASCLLKGIGLPFLGYLAYRTITTKRRRRALQANLLGLLERHHQDVIDNLYVENRQVIANESAPTHRIGQETRA